MRQTLKQHISQLIESLEQEQNLEIEIEETTHNLDIDFREFNNLFLAPRYVTTFNEYGQTRIVNLTLGVSRPWRNAELPDYDNEAPFTEDPGDPEHLPPENSGAIDWTEYNTIKCEVATKYVRALEDAWVHIVDLLATGYKTLQTVALVLIDAVVGVVAIGATITTAGVSIPVGVVVGAIVNILGIFSLLLTDFVADSLKNVVINAREGLICALYQNRSPSAIKAAWDAAIDSEMDGLQWAPMRLLWKIMLPNRHARLLAEGVGQREWGATCAMCGAQLAERYLFDSEDRPEIPYHRIWPDQHVPPFVVGASRADQFLHQGWEKRYKVGSFFDGTIVFWWEEFEGGPGQVREHGKSEHGVFHVFPEPCFSYYIYRPSQSNFGFAAEIWTTT